MNKTEKLTMRIEPDIKERGNAVLSALGLSASDAIGMFYRQLIINNGLPFEAKVPNDETLKAMQDLRDPKTRKTLETFNDMSELLVSID
tara:strand:+ start:1851 stop:2117 length:267 start_codon:yes stop_codon:yes gene_type:complete